MELAPSPTFTRIHNFYPRKPRSFSWTFQYPLINLCLRNQQTILKSDCIGVNWRHLFYEAWKPITGRSVGDAQYITFSLFALLWPCHLEYWHGNLFFVVKQFFLSCLFPNLSNNPLLPTAF